MQTVQQTVEISQVPFMALLLTRPLLCNDRCLGAQCLVRQWIHVLRQFEQCFMDEFSFFYVKVELWILRSILVSASKHGRRGSGRARRRLWHWHAFSWFCWF